MEGDQKFDIPLDSELDINSNNMLVNPSNPKFLDNTQQKLGSLSTNSVRFEDDGWFAGWLGHKFDFLSEGNNLFDGIPREDMTVMKRIIEGKEMYLIRYEDVSILFNPSQSETWLYGTGTIVRNGDAELNITGQTNGNPATPFTLKVNPYTGELLESSLVNQPDFIVTSSRNGYSIVVDIRRDSKKNFITIRRNKTSDIDGTISNYSIENGISNWGDSLSFDPATMQLSAIPGSGFEVDTFNVENPGAFNEVITAECKNTAVATYNNATELTDVWLSAKPTNVKLTADYISTGSEMVERKENRLNLTTLYTKPDDFSPEIKVGYRYDMPVWLNRSVQLKNIQKDGTKIKFELRGLYSIADKLKNNGLNAVLGAEVTVYYKGNNGVNLKPGGQYNHPLIKNGGADADATLYGKPYFYTYEYEGGLTWQFYTYGINPNFNWNEKPTGKTLRGEDGVQYKYCVDGTNPLFIVLDGPSDVQPTINLKKCLYLYNTAYNDTQPISFGSEVIIPGKMAAVPVYFAFFDITRNAVEVDVPVTEEQMKDCYFTVRTCINTATLNMDEATRQTLLSTMYPLGQLLDIQGTIDASTLFTRFWQVSAFDAVFTFNEGVFSEDKVKVEDSLNKDDSYMYYRRVPGQRNRCGDWDRPDNRIPVKNIGDLLYISGSTVMMSYASCSYGVCAGEISFINVNQAGHIIDSASCKMTYRTLSRDELAPFITDEDGNVEHILRLDDGGMTRDAIKSNINNYVLDLITNNVTLTPSLQNGIAPVSISATYNGKGVLFIVTAKPSTLDEEGNKVQGVDYVYPAWATTGNAYESNNDVSVFVPNGNIVNISMFIKTGKRVINSAPTIEVTPNTEFNSSLFNNIEVSCTTEQPKYGIMDGGVLVDIEHVTDIAPDADNRYNVVTDTFVPTTAGDGDNLLNVIDAVPYQRIVYSIDEDTSVTIDMDLNEGTVLGQPVIVNNGKYIIDNIVIDLPTISFTLKYADNVRLHATLYRTLITNKAGVMAPVDIVSQTDNILTLTDGTVDFNKKELTNLTLGIMDKMESNDRDGTVTFYISIMDLAKFSVIPAGLVVKAPASLEYVSSTNTTVTFEHNGRHTITVDPNGDSNIVYSIRDIREAEGEYKPIYKRNADDIYMYVKQFWSNTVDIENYWWFDKDHVLELSNALMTLHVKDGARPVDDWMGDRWLVEKQIARSEWIGTSDLYYTLTNAYKAQPVFLKIQATAESITFVYAKDLLNQDFDNMDWKSVKVNIEDLDLGVALSSTSISSFLPVVGTAIIANRKISTTVVDTTLMIGLVYAKGMQQWTVMIDLNTDTLVRVVNGYGYVGLNGCLTGGQFPINCVNETGFNAVVRDINELKDIPETKIDFRGGILNIPTSIPNACYSNGTVVWFIYESISGICSHYTYANGVHTPVELTLNNNVSSMYQSESFLKGAIYDLRTIAFGINDMFVKPLSDSPAGSALGFVIDLVTGAIQALNPTYTQFLNIQHSLGQYAYVWKNNTQETTTDNASDTDKTMTFGKRSISITAASDGSKGATWLCLILKGLKTLVEPAVDYFANNAQDKTSFNDKTGKKLSQFFVENVATTAGSAIGSVGSSVSLKSTISTMYTLDMFYSISNKSQCHAGPGFVQHNLTSLCTAQSVTDTQVKGDRYKVLVSLATFSLAMMEYKNKLLYNVYELLKEQIGAVGSFTFGGPALSAIFAISAGIAYATYVVGEIGLIVNKGIAETIGGTPAESYQQGSMKKFTLTVEAPHNYGQRSMVFMWPAFGIYKNNTYTNEAVQATYNEDKQEIEMGSSSGYVDELAFLTKKFWTLDSNDKLVDKNKSPTKMPLRGDLYSVQVQCRAAESTGQVQAPDDMAVVEGTTAFLTKEKVGFKNENIGVTNPVFPPPVIHDFIVDKQWNLGVTALGGEIISVMQDDTKLIDGAPSNIVITDDFCGIASSYIAMEVKDSYDENYLRPWAITPQCIALNINRINSVHRGTAYHSFDGYGNRIVNWKGDAGLDKEFLVQQYLFQINDNFKRSNIWPPSQFMGSFMGPPSVALRTYDKIANLYQSNEQGVGIDNNIPGEQKNLARFSVPVHSHLLSTLPAMLRMLQPYKLHVVEGVTSLCTDIRSTQTAYKAPSSIDFNINGVPYRATDEFICSLKMQAGIVAVQDVVASQGLDFIGATTTEAYFYSQSTRMYYAFSGGNSIQKMEVLHRFKEVIEGKWDFVTQEVIVKVLDTFDTFHVIRLDNKFTGQVYKPNLTVANRDTKFKLLSMAGGITYQGPKRFAVTRFIINDYMVPNILENKGKWVKLSRDDYYIERDYGWVYEDFSTIAPIEAVSGWTHNPFRLTTAMLGLSEETDCKFEWSITFAWTPIMEKLFGLKEYVTVNVRAETVTEGGVKLSDVTHIFLFRECFTRVDDGGYYTFQFQSNNGIGNRERLFIWCDGIISVESLQLSVKQMTARRTQPLNTQVDLISYKEQ